MTNTPKLILFDCDGTIVDSQQQIVKAMRSAFEAAGVPSPANEQIRSIIGLSLHEAVAHLAGDAGESEKQTIAVGYRDAFVSQRAAPDFHEPLYDGAREAIEHLANRDDYILGVATGKTQQGVAALFEREGLGDYFYTIQTSDDAPSKPHPGMIENALRHTGIDPKNTVMIGDTTYDVAMAVNAKANAVGVSWGYHETGELRASGAHAICDEYPALPDLIEKLF